MHHHGLGGGSTGRGSLHNKFLKVRHGLGNTSQTVKTVWHTHFRPYVRAVKVYTAPFFTPLKGESPTTYSSEEATNHNAVNIKH